MKIYKKIDEIKEESRKLKATGKFIGFVPTMGFFHEGHLSLVRESVKKTDCTVVSIFVNPTQFGPREDFKSYPRNLEKDLETLEKEGIDYVFVPDNKEIYPEGYRTYVEVHDLQDKLCGESRPGHFRGVCTVVLKFFNIIKPDVSFFGQKDAQQAIILKKMVRDLNLDIKIEVLPIVRDKDGLALSSRNYYLDNDGRKAALCLFKSLKSAREMIMNGEKKAEKIKRRMKEIIQSEPLAKIDYIEIVDMDNLEHMGKIEDEALVALAAFIGNARLIDNMIVNVKD